MTGFFSPSLFRGEKPGNALIAKCGACGLFKGCQSPKMKPYGRGCKQVLVVGETPGAAEDDQGRPFVGREGELLRETLRSVGVDLDQDAVSTNSLICKPPNNASPDAKEIGYCHPNLKQTIEDLQPRVIVTLGHSALKSVLTGIWKDEVKALERWVGWQIPWKDFWICPTYHPSYLLRNEDEMLNRHFQNHLEAAFGIQTLPAAQRVDDLELYVEVIYDEGNVKQALLEFDRAGGWVSVDLENNCLKPEYENAKILCASVSNGDRTIVFPWTPRNRANLYRLLKSPRTRKIAANLKHEERWFLAEYGEGVANWGWDTVVAAHCLDNRPMTTALKFQLFVQFGVETYNAHIDPYLEGWQGSHYNRIHLIDQKQLLTYCGIDAIGEYKLAMRQRKEMGYAV